MGFFAAVEIRVSFLDTVAFARRLMVWVFLEPAETRTHRFAKFDFCPLHKHLWLNMNMNRFCT